MRSSTDAVTLHATMRHAAGHSLSQMTVVQLNVVCLRVREARRVGPHARSPPVSGTSGRGGRKRFSGRGRAGFDVIFDTVGGATLDASFASVRRYTGHVVSILGWGTHSLAPLSFRGATYSGVFSLLPLLTGQHRGHHGAILQEIAILADAGGLTPNVDPSPFTLDTVPDAHHALETRSNTGKIVIEIG